MIDTSAYLSDKTLNFAEYTGNSTGTQVALIQKVPGLISVGVYRISIQQSME